MMLLLLMEEWQVARAQSCVAGAEVAANRRRPPFERVVL
jgi:hypothetical protein